MPAVPDDQIKFEQYKKNHSLIYGPPDCAHPIENIEGGFGLAGGGYGVYNYCTLCNRILNKTQIED